MAKDNPVDDDQEFAAGGGIYRDGVHAPSCKGHVFREVAEVWGFPLAHRLLADHEGEQ